MSGGVAAGASAGGSGVKSVNNGTYSTIAERIARTPKGCGNSSDHDGCVARGHWTGERGNSKFVPTEMDRPIVIKRDGEIVAVYSSDLLEPTLAAYVLDGIEYSDGIPDFSPCAEATVKITCMTEKRSANFSACDERLAEQWSKEKRTEWNGKPAMLLSGDEAMSIPGMNAMIWKPVSLFQVS